MIIIAVVLIATGIWFIDCFIQAEQVAVEPPGGNGPPVEEETPEVPKVPPAEPINQIPILMYHVIGDGSGSLQELYVNADVFASQMQYLKDNGYHTVTLSELYQHWQDGTPLPPRPIVLTFDDGYRSDYEVAFPILQAHDFRAVHFLYVKKLSHANSLTRQELAELLTRGHEVGNHTYNHIEIHTVSQERLIQETQQAKDALEERLDIEIVSFCYPVGRYNSEAVGAVEESGHKIAVTTEYGYASPEQGLLTLKRVRINRSDGLQGFIQKLKQYEGLEPQG